MRDALVVHASQVLPTRLSTTWSSHHPAAAEAHSCLVSPAAAAAAPVLQTAGSFGVSISISIIAYMGA